MTMRKVQYGFGEAVESAELDGTQDGVNGAYSVFCFISSCLIGMERFYSSSSLSCNIHQGLESNFDGL